MYVNSGHIFCRSFGINIRRSRCIDTCHNRWCSLFYINANCIHSTQKRSRPPSIYLEPNNDSERVLTTLSHEQLIALLADGQPSDCAVISPSLMCHSQLCEPFRFLLSALSCTVHYAMRSIATLTHKEIPLM